MLFQANLLINESDFFYMLTKDLYYFMKKASSVR